MQPPTPIVLTADTAAGKLKEITDRLETGITELFESDRYAEYLRVMSKFHDYSYRNLLLILMQCPSASRIAGFGTWKKEFDRYPRAGEKSIKILAPAPIKTAQEVPQLDPTGNIVVGADGAPVTEQQEIIIPRFRVVSVFDVSQTDGKPLPSIAVDELTGNVERFGGVVAALQTLSPVPIGFEQIASGAKGYYHQTEKRIAVQEEMSELQTLKTLIHEIAHAKLHDSDPNAPQDKLLRPGKRTREVQAESVAYVVCQHFGLDTSEYSFAYIAGWSAGKELPELKASLDTVRKAAAEIIDGVEHAFAAKDVPERIPLTTDIKTKSQKKEMEL
jgi:antirestriction protein ArdC